MRKCEKSFFCKTGRSGDSLVTRTSRKFQSRNNWLAKLSFFCPIVLQLSWPFSFLHASHMWHFGKSSIASHSQVLVAGMLLNVHTLKIFTLSHTQSLHDSHLNTGYLIAELQANLARNKTNTWLSKFNLTRGNYNTSQSSKKNED